MEAPVSLTREAIAIEPRMILTIKEGTPPVTSEKQRAYESAREQLLNPHVKFSTELVATTLKARDEELTEAIANSPLKGAADRGGYTLGSLKELTDLASRELGGELNAKGVLKRTLEIITDEEESKVRNEARSLTSEGISIDTKSGSIIHKTFPSQSKREMASIEADDMKQRFMQGKDRLQRFASELK
jgi:hypothetical protein